MLQTNGGSRVWLGVLSLWLAAAVSCADVLPFILPWNDGSPGPTDLSALNPPIGAADRVAVDADGHFTARGQRVRFLGMNFAGDSPFMPMDKADAVAARLAKFGINCVRFHHMDAPWATGGGLINYGLGNSRQLRAAQLDRVHFLVSRLKAHGIYANVNLLVGRQFAAADGLPAEVNAMDWKDQHILGCFNAAALNLHKEYARQLLTTTNKFTGVPLAQDSGVAFVEIMNENGMLQKWFEGALDRLPSIFAAQLNSKWNDWLVARYTNDAAMLAAWKVIDEPLGANLVKNGAFTSQYTSWNKEQHELARATFTVENAFNGQPAARIDVTTPGTQGWHVQLNQANLSLTSNQAYTLTFSAKAATNTPLDVSVMQGHANWLPLGYTATKSLTNGWQQFSAAFQATATDNNARVNFGGFATRTSTMWIADVRLQKGGQIGGLPAGVSLPNRNLPSVLRDGASGAFTQDAQKDWMRCALDLERAYWSDMISYVRQTCGYTGLIFGTIIANSTPNVQAAQFDVIDGHAYWEHPQFPGTPWDATNWFIPNTSMLNTLGVINTLEGLACQRVKGRPFTVTEYQHPSPNNYGAEGPLLIAAYGALQDWDGLWLFDYGPGTDAVSMGYFRSYFDTAQHPTKMANLFVAASLFRRGDVRPALNEITMALPPEKEIDAAWLNGGAWAVVDGRHLGVPGKLAMVNRLSLSVGANAAGLTLPPAEPAGSVLTSDTGELEWSFATAGKGYVTVNTPRTKSVLGFTDGKLIELGGVKFQPGVTQLGWSTLSLTLVEGNAFTNAGRAILVAAGQVTNTAMQWTDPTHTSVGNKWGRSPVLAESVPFQLTLPVTPDRVKVTALEQRGQRRTAVDVAAGAGGTTLFNATTNLATIWYEIQIAADTPFDRWRFSHFTADELVHPTISGPEASPANDGVPNLLKYSLGLDPRAPLPAHPLTASVAAINGTDRLALSYARAKSATDVAFIPDVSMDLVSWSGNAQFSTTGVDDLGLTELVTLTSNTPLGAAPAQYVRLKLQLNP